MFSHVTAFLAGSSPLHFPTISRSFPAAPERAMMRVMCIMGGVQPQERALGLRAKQILGRCNQVRLLPADLGCLLTIPNLEEL